MKTTLIVILGLLLALAAFLTRPGRREFVFFLLDSQSSEGSGSADFSRAESALKDVKFNDHWLWVDVEHDGKVMYTGLFSHFVPHNLGTEKALPSVEQLAKLVKAEAGK
jgi:hypothetical protein